MPRFAANLSMMFTEVPFIERFAAARKAGFDAVEFLFPYDYSPQQIQQQLVQNHLTLALFNTAPGDINAGEWGLSALPGREHEARADIDLALEYALALNCEQVHVMAGVVPAGEDAERYRAVFIDNLRYAADRFAPHGKRILVEALSPGVKPHYLFSSQYQALAIVEEVARDNVFIQLDTFHAATTPGNMRTYKLPDYLIDMNRTMEKSTIRGCSACSMKWDIRAGSVVNTNLVASPKKGLAGLTPGANSLNP